jgi:hypothetical protein
MPACDRKSRGNPGSAGKLGETSGLSASAPSPSDIQPESTASRGGDSAPDGLDGLGGAACADETVSVGSSSEGHSESMSSVGGDVDEVAAEGTLAETGSVADWVRFERLGVASDSRSPALSLGGKE